MGKLKLLVMVVAVTASLLGIYRNAPGLRAMVDGQIVRWTDWSDEAIQQDPAGFVRAKVKQVQKDIAEMKKTRSGLAGQLDELDKKLEEQRARLTQAEMLLSEFRAAHRRAEYPVVIRRAAYDSGDITRQVSMLLAEADGYRDSIERLEEVQAQAEQQLEDLTLRINTSESQAIALATQVRLLEARQLDDRGQELVDQVDQLLNGTREAIASYAVRPLEELIAAEEPQAAPQPSFAAAREFLESDDEPAREDAIPAPEVVEKKQQRAKIRGRLIFEQS